MGDTGTLKKDVGRKSSKNSNIKRIVSLFEISRPNKSKGLQRANSLPASKRPSIPPTEKEHSSSHTRGSLGSSYSTTGKVQRIKEEIEQKNKRKEIISTPKPVKKKTQSNRRKLGEQVLKPIDWLSDKAKIMDDLNKLQERIEDVTEEIENSDTELEITYRKVRKDDHVFERTEGFSYQDILRDKFGDEDSDDPLHRLSSDSVFSVVSSDTVKEASQSQLEECDDNISVNYESTCGLVLVEAPEEDNEENETTAFRTKIYIDELNSNNETERESTGEYFQEEGTAIEETDNAESIKATEPEETTDHYIDGIFQNDNSAQFNPIEWWKHKSFVQINNEAMSEKISSEPEITENLDTEEETSVKTGRFIKNNRSSKRERRRTGIIKRPVSVKDLAKHFEGFKDAAESGETENFRKSFIQEMDEELENMRNDGFKEDFHLSMENLTLLNFEDDNDNKDDAISLDKSLNSDETYEIRNSEEENISTSDQDDTFGEILFNEDLENGLYCLEAYNADGKELIMCLVHIDRKSVDLNSFDKLKAQSGSNVLTNYDKTLVLMEGADAISINESKSGSDSKRNTIYSTTSGESYDDEGIDIENASTSYGYSAARRETYCDNQGVIRIERVVPYSENAEEPPDYLMTKNNYYYSSQEEPVNEEEENYYESISLEHEIMLFSIPKVKKETLHYIVEEIKSTERKYVADMKKVLTEYKVFLEDRCPDKVDIVFANMDQIYRLQLRLLQTLEESGIDVKRVVQAFIDSEDLFRLYPRYFKNTPKANAAVKELSFLIKEKQDRINDKLDLSAYLLTPLQRLGKYKLFLENIIKQLEKEQKPIGAVQMALDIIKKYMSKGNDAVAIASILRSPLHTKDYGSFISREKFILLKPKRLELMVFLFEAVVVFTTEDPKNMEQFEYYKSIKTNDLRIATFDDTTLHLTDFTKTKKRNSSKYTLILDAKTLKLKSSWKQQIEDILWKQMKKIKENTLKEYQVGNKTPRKPTRSREQRSKSTGSSTFYID